MSYVHLLPFALVVIGLVSLVHRFVQVKKAGGIEAQARNKLNQVFGLRSPEQVSAAWSAVTVPKLSAGEKAAEVMGAAAAVVVGVGVRIVGRELGIASTSHNRIIVFDKEDNLRRAFEPDNRPRFVDAERKGTKRPSQTRIGFDDGAIVRLEIAAEEPVEIDIVATAVPVLVGWSRGEDVSHLRGPFPIAGVV